MDSFSVFSLVEHEADLCVVGERRIRKAGLCRTMRSSPAFSMVVYLA